MKNIKYIIVLLSLVLLQTEALADKSWIKFDLSQLGSLFRSCIEAPRDTSFNNGVKSLDLSSPGVWVSTGENVDADKAITFNWSTLGAEAKPRKYLVLYRIDPRFSRPQVFIQKYDYIQRKYVSDFHEYQGGKLPVYQTNPYMTPAQRVSDYLNYFNFIDRPKISVNKGDVVNITLKPSSSFFDSNSDFKYELNGVADPTLTYTRTPDGSDNKILYTSAGAWCDFISLKEPSLSSYCHSNQYTPINPSQMLIGIANETSFAFASIFATGASSCPEVSNTKDLSTLCVYDKGRGMKITVNGSSIKDTEKSFIHSNITNTDFFYYKSDVSGGLDFVTDWTIGDGMFSNSFHQFIKDWVGITDTNYGNAGILPAGSGMNFLHIGRYAMIIEIGNGANALSTEEQSAIGVEYIVSNTTPGEGVSGESVSQNSRTNAAVGGNLWLRVINPNTDIQGTITVNYSNYTGSTFISNIIYNHLITPLRDEFRKLTKLFYTKLFTNVILQRISQLALSIYVIIYGLFFLAGATKITVTDIVTRVIKVSLVVALFRPGSWEFFNDNLFNAYMGGSDYLMTSATGMSSSATNVFGFIDPIFDKYSNPQIWALLFIQLFQIHNGLAFFAIMIIYSLLVFFRSTLEVIIGYCLAFLSLAVLISLAPFFITFMLFEQTKGLFDNWLSLLFSYMIQPTILLIFFLLIDQIVSPQILLTVSKACWGTLIPIEIGLDLRALGIPISFGFSLPFLPEIPFFITEVAEVQNVTDIFSNPQGTILTVVTGSLLFYSFCLMAKGLVAYMTVVIAMLTNVAPARTSGQGQSSDNPISSVMGDLGKFTQPVKDVARSHINRAKEGIKDAWQGNSRSGGNSDGGDGDSNRGVGGAKETANESSKPFKALAEITQKPK